MLVEITEGPGMNIQIPRLPRAVVPLSPVKFWYNAGHGRWARFEQLALPLASHICMHRIQSSRSNYVAWCSTRPQLPARGKTPSTLPYVRLSCVTSLNMVFILKPFDIVGLRALLSDELLTELACEEMASNIKRLYEM